MAPKAEAGDKRTLWAIAKRFRPFDPITADQARLTVQSAVAVAIACLFAVIDALWTHMGMNGTWIIITVMVVLEPTMGAGLRKSFLRVVGTLVGGLTGLAMLYCAYAASDFQDWQGGSVEMAVTVTCLQALATALLLLWKVQHASYSYAYLVAVFTQPIVWVPGLRANDGQEAWPAIRRMISILIGIGIAAVCQVLVLPVFARRQLTERLAASLEDAVDMILTTTEKLVYEPPGERRDGAASHTARLQRAQRKAAAQLDGLVGPTAMELRLLPGPLSAAAFGQLVDCAAAIGSEAVHLVAVLEAAHAEAEGGLCHTLPPDVEEPVDAASAALAAAFAVLAARIRGTLHGCCLRRHHWDEALCPSCIVRHPASRPPVAAALGQDSGAALEAAAAALRRLTTAHQAALERLTPSEADLSVAAQGACQVLLLQARAVAALLEAAGVKAAAGDQAEVVQLSAAAAAAANGKAGGRAELGAGNGAEAADKV